MLGGPTYYFSPTTWDATVLESKPGHRRYFTTTSSFRYRYQKNIMFTAGSRKKLAVLGSGRQRTGILQIVSTVLYSKIAKKQVLL